MIRIPVPIIKLWRSNVKNTVSPKNSTHETCALFFMMDFRIFEIILPFLLACGNNLTYGKDVDNIKEWPSLAVAFNEVSNVHCTATIGTYSATG